MQPQQKKWMRVLSDSTKYQQKSFDNKPLTQSRSKSKKYNPLRNSGQSDLNKKIKLLNNSRVNTSTELQMFPSKQSFRQSLTKIYDQGQSPGKKQRSQKFDLRAIMKPTIQQPGSPNILIKKLREIEKQQQKKETQVTKVLFSLDQQHRYIHQELSKIKTQYIKFKQLVNFQLVKLKRQLNDITKGIQDKLNQVIQLIHKSIPSQNTQVNQFNLSLEKCQSLQGIHVQNFFVNDNGIAFSEIAIKNQNSLLTDSKDQLKKNLELQSLKFSQSKNPNQIPMVKPKYEASKTERINISEKNTKKQSNNSNQNESKKNEDKKLINNRSASKIVQRHQNNSKDDKLITLKSKSKRQFQKLFQAVNCLKKDIKDLKNMGNSTNQKFNQFNQYSSFKKQYQSTTLKR